MIDDVKLKEEVFMLKQHHGLLLHTMSNPLQDLCQAHTELEVGNADRLIFVLFALNTRAQFHRAAESKK